MRINGKQARYAVDAVAPVIGGPAEKLAKALGRVQTLLGEHQDAAVAADTWVDVAAHASRRPDARGDRGPAVRAGARLDPRGALGVPRRVAARRRAAKDRMASVTPVRAAGGVVWRTGPDGAGVQICLVHRPRYDDWSLPKGKLEKGEHPLAAAVREVGEETGVRAVPQVRLPGVNYALRDGTPKTVDYWSMRCESVDGRRRPTRSTPCAGSRRPTPSGC